MSERDTTPPPFERKGQIMAEGATARVSRANYGAIPPARVVHKGSGRFTNLVGEKRGNEIIFDEAAGTVLFDVLGERLG
ncbi:MAG: hypothetical protein ACRDQ4_16610 [Pseudonocardiaceae bacterium]